MAISIRASSTASSAAQRADGLWTLGWPKRLHLLGKRVLKGMTQWYTYCKVEAKSILPVVGVGGCR